jgi:hypothetical protein
MKTKIYSILAGLLLTTSLFAQAPQTMTYQAVVRNNSDALVVSSPIGIRVSILIGSVTGTAAYVETHTTQTNQNGLLDIVIGGGAVISGTYNDIIWADGPYFLKTEIDPNGSTNYSITSTSELLSVPYSNYAQIAGAVDSKCGFVNPGGLWGNFSIPNNKNKRPKKVTIKYITTVSVANTWGGVAVYDILCESEWYDGNRDGLGDLFYKVDPLDIAYIGYASIKGNGYLLNTNKLGQIYYVSSGFNSSGQIPVQVELMQEIMISSTLTDITIYSTQPVSVTDSDNNFIYTILGPWKAIYNIEW